MNKSTFLALSALLILPLSSANKAEVVFKNGDKLVGELDTLTHKDLLLKHAAFANDQNVEPLLLEKIASLKFPEHKSESSKGKTEGHITMYPRRERSLPNDLYKGNIKTINEDSIVIDTAYAGELTLNKAFVQKLDIFNNNYVVFPSLGKLSDWNKSLHASKITQKGESFEFGKSSGSNMRYIHREIDFPEKYELTAEVERNSSSNSRIYFHLHANSSGQSYGKKTTLVTAISTYEVRITRQNSSTGQDIVYRNQGLDNALRSAKIWKIKIFVDTKKKTISIFMNGIKLADNQPIPNLDPKKLGTHLSFQNNTYESITLKSLEIRKWNGSRRSPSPSKRIALKEPFGEPIELQNGDMVHGKITQIEDGVAHIETKHGEFKLNLGIISSLNLGLTEEEQIKMQMNDARIRFTDGSRFIIKIEKIEDGKIFGSSQAFKGSQGFDISKIQSIEFESSIYPF